jgi:hypothetical protein
MSSWRELILLRGFTRVPPPEFCAGVGFDAPGVSGGFGLEAPGTSADGAADCAICSAAKDTSGTALTKRMRRSERSVVMDYRATALPRESSAAFKACFDHPTETDSRERPGRSVRELAGHYENVKAKKDSEGVMSLQADFVPISTHEEVQGLLNHAIDYKKKYPDSDFVGISINGDGEGETLDWDQFVKSIKPNTFEMKKLAKIEGQQVNVIRKLTAAVSADLVTEPGARGRLLLEQEKRRITYYKK